MSALLARIDAVDPLVRAWVRVDRERALAVAAECEADAWAGRFRGPLHGIPVAVKDIFDVADMPTGFGAAEVFQQRPAVDSVAVSRLRRAGAIILGKVTTAEFAFFDPPETRNPWNPDHTPGGSSSGSAAAVAGGMVPLAIGSQTAGSVLRPAAYCGVVGLKPAHGRISCRGVAPLTPEFDHVGTLSRCVADAALALDVLAGYDPADPFSLAEPAGGHVAALSSGGPDGVRLGFVRRPYLDRAGPEVAAHVEATAGRLAGAGAVIEEVALPGSLEGLYDAGFRVMQVGAAAVHRDRYARHRDRLRPKLRGLIEAGMEVSGVDHAVDQEHCRRFRAEVGPLLTGVDALLLPVTDSTAPEGLASTGDPSFCGPWSFSGLPALALPSGLSGDGLPLAVQLVAADERRLLRVAAWCEGVCGTGQAPPLPG
jgi:Asp-tRNA(Asn)/Glu-tRNA(Gln) amidotransferase A subunit family amidase